jgi:hypothetical protein
MLGCSKKKEPFFLNFYSLPLMLEKTLFLLIETRCLVDVFEGCLAGIRRLGKKIGCQKV